MELREQLGIPEWVPDNIRILHSGSYEEWQGRRFSGLGGSDVSTIFGVNPYRDKYTLWAEKTGRAAPPVETSLMRFGQVNEKLVREEYERRNEVTVWNDPLVTLQHPEDDWWRYSPDGLVVETPRLFEAKTARRWTEWSDGASDHSEAQVNGGMALIGLPHMDAGIMVMVAGDPENMQQFTIPYNQRAADIVREEIARFWHDHIVKDVPPEPDYRELDALLGTYSSTIQDSTLVSEDAEVAAAVDDYRRGREMVKEGERIRDTAKAKLLLAAGEYESIESPDGDLLYTYKSQVSRWVTNKGLLDAGLDPEDYKTETTSRVLRVK